MDKNSSRAITLSALIMLVLAGMVAQGSDWPAFRRDARRGSVAGESLDFPLHLAWHYTSVQPPAPAWRSTTKYFNRLDFDHAPQPVVADSILVFGSSADDTIRALDAVTGAKIWRYATGGPVRFAPHVYNGRVYAASDDGWVYCLELGTGREVWKFRAAPRADLILGDNRMISVWPLRTGLIVDAGVVYTVAGMWPSEGVFVYALDAETGDAIWINDTSGTIAPGDGGITGAGAYRFGNHVGSGVAPQGWLLAGTRDLVVPQGRAAPARFDRRTGLLKDIGGALKHTYSTAPPFTLVGDQEFMYTDTHNTKWARGGDASEQTIAGSRFTGLPQPSRGQDGILDPDKGLHVDPVRGFDVTLLATAERLYARQGYSIALAGDILLVGENGTVAAYTSGMTAPESRRGRWRLPARYDPEGQTELWRQPVNGQARGLAVAGGRVYVSTDRGEIYCFAPISGQPGHHVPDVQEPVVRPDAATAGLIAQLQSAGMDQGYALLAGDPGGRLAVTLATLTSLRIISLADADAASDLRDRLLNHSRLYGSRIHVLALPSDGRLPLPPYFADTVIVAGDTGSISVPASEFYRVLRPLGGFMFATGVTSEHAGTFLHNATTNADEFRMTPQPHLRRGALPGALDWDSTNEGDRYLRAPVRYLWFGGPDPMTFTARAMGGPATANVIAANGRFFQLLNGEVVAIDAYNGRELWRRFVPRELRPLEIGGETFLAGAPPFSRNADAPYHQWRRAPSAIRGFAADADSVYITFGDTCFRGEGELCVQLDAASGTTRAMYGQAAPPVEEIALPMPRNWKLTIDDETEGTLAMSATPTGIRIELRNRSATISAGDFWTLFFDFRPAAQRYGLYGRETFSVTVSPARDDGTPAHIRPGRGDAIPALGIEGSRTGEGAVSILTLSWDALADLTGGRPRSFGFAASLRSDREGRRSRLALAGNEAWLFGDPMADALNNGWAAVMLSPSASDLAAMRRPATILGPLDTVAAAMRRYPDPRAYNRPDPDALRTGRVHPLTGLSMAKDFTRGNGCGMIFSSAYVQYMRSGTLGLFDMLEDSGIRHYGGIRPSCGMNILAASGVLFASEDDTDCGCLYSFRIPFALANTDRPLHEDWALFENAPLEGPVRQAAINLAAPGDRRDDNATMWLGFPRFAPQRPTPDHFEIPFQIDYEDGMGPYRVNADRVPIAGTGRPWLYASQFRGIRMATLRLGKQQSLVAVTLRDAPPAIDGKLDDPAWQGDADFRLPNTGTELFVRHDAHNLYIVARRPARVDRLGREVAWIAATRGTDAPVWQDSSLEVFFSDSTGASVMHLGVSASGARYDALARPGASSGDARWNGNWQTSVTADNRFFVVEMAVPLATLRGAGLNTAQLAINVLANSKRMEPDDTEPTIAEALRYPGDRGRERCAHFIPLGLGSVPDSGERSFTVRLHFADLAAGSRPGGRVFDVKLQGRLVLESFDPVHAAGGAQAAVVREFTGVTAGDALTLEFIPRNPPVTAENAPILNAIEIYEENIRIAASGP